MAKNTHWALPSRRYLFIGFMLDSWSFEGLVRTAHRGSLSHAALPKGCWHCDQRCFCFCADAFISQSPCLAQYTHLFIHIPTHVGYVWGSLSALHWLGSLHNAGLGSAISLKAAAPTSRGMGAPQLCLARLVLTALPLCSGLGYSLELEDPLG